MFVRVHCVVSSLGSISGGFKFNSCSRCDQERVEDRCVQSVRKVPWFRHEGVKPAVGPEYDSADAIYLFSLQRLRRYVSWAVIGVWT
jgi:hypothetical protein